MKRRAVVDARAGCLFVSSESATEGAYPAYVQGDWIQRVDEAIDDAGLGDLVRSALAASRVGVPFPDFRHGPTRERLALLKLAGVKSDAQFERGLRTVGIGIDEAGSELRIAPFRNDGRKAGFTEISEQVITLRADADDAAVGEAVHSALVIATGGP